MATTTVCPADGLRVIETVEQGNESFAALVDSNTPVENSGNDRATSRPQQQSAFATPHGGYSGRSR
jgi:hypothetical protein